jgi:DNA polymerase III alpha subunit (gram-positive type)
MKRYFAFDLETTGVDVVNDEPVEIAYAIVREDGSYVVPTVSHLVNTSRTIHPARIWS